MTHLIKTTMILMGKGIKPGTHTDTRYFWKVTDKALAKIKANGIRFEIVK